MITDTSKARALIVDHGASIELARRLAEDYAKVYYCNFTSTGYPTMAEELVGYGFPEIEVVNNPWQVLDKIDLAVFPDVNDGPLQVHFAEKLQIPVWGSRMAEQLEIDRVFIKNLMEKLGLPVGDWDEVVGVTALRKYIEEHPDIWVKMSRYRGDWESTCYDNYATAKNDLDRFEHKMGLLADIARFICEKPLKNKVEIGRDNYNVLGKWPERALLGLEVKDLGYCGKVVHDDDLPEYIHRFDTAMEPTFKKFKYQGDISTEIRVGKDHEPHMIDACCRRANNPGFLCMELYKNTPEIILKGAQGELVQPDIAAEWGAEAIIYSTSSAYSAAAAVDGDPVTIEFPKDVEQFVKLRNHIKVNGQHQVQPARLHYPQIGSVIGMGNTLKEAEDMVREIADEIKGAVKIKVDSFSEAEKQIELLKEYKIKVF